MARVGSASTGVRIFMNLMKVAFVCLVAAFGGASLAQAQSVDWLVNIDDAGFDPIPAGGTISYVIEVDTNGAQAAPPTTVTVDIPATTRLTGVSGEFTNCTSGGNPLGATLDGPASVTCDVPNITATGATSQRVGVFDVLALSNQVIAVTATLPTSAPDGSGGTATDPDAGNNTLTEQTTVQAGADLSLTLNAPATATSGGFIDYDITVLNNGPNTSNSFTIEFPIPTGVFGITGSGGGALPSGCSIGGRTVTCLVTGPLTSTNSIVRSFRGQISAAGSSTITASASVVSPNPGDPVTSNNTRTASTNTDAGIDARISIVQSGGGSLLVGDTSTFTISSTYSGSAPTGDTTVEFTLPANYTFNGLTTAGAWSCTTPTVGANGGAFTCTHPAAGLTSGNVNYGGIVVETTAASAGTPSVTADISVAGPADQNLSNNSATVTASISAPTVDLRANKRGPDPAVVVDGASYNYQITATNIGNADFIGIVRMVDTLPAGMRVTSINQRDWTCTPSAPLPLDGPATVTCEREYTAAAPLGPNVTTPNVVLRTLITDSSAGSLSNTNTVSTISTGPDSILDTRNVNDTVTVTVTAQANANSADVSVSKTALQPSVAVGDIQTFQIVVENAGPQPAEDVEVLDVLRDLINNRIGPTDAGFVSATVTPGNATNPVCTPISQSTAVRLNCTIDTLPVCNPAASECPVIEVSIRPGGEAGSRFNTATASSDTTGDPVRSNNRSRITYDVTARADVTVTKSATPTPVRAGQDITYVITAANLNTVGSTTTPANLSTADAVTITDMLPDNVRFVSATPSSGTCTTTPPVGAITSSDEVICDLGSIASGAQRTVTIVVTPTNATRGTTVDNTVSVRTDTDETDTTNNDATVSVPVQQPSLDILVNKDDSVDPVPLGGTTVYTLRVTNAGPSASENVVVTDVLPDAIFAYRSHTISGAGTCGTVPVLPQPTPDPIAANRTLECTFPFLPVGASETIEITMQGVAPGSIPNEVTISSDEIVAGFDTQAANNRTSETTTVGTGTIGATDATISGTLYRDFDNSATSTVSGQDLPGDTGVSGITITLTGTAVDSSSVSRTTMTDANGDYIFDNLPEGIYTITRGAVSLAGFVDGQNTIGSEGGSLPNQTEIATIVLPESGAGVNYDFAVIPAATATPDIALIKTANTSALTNPAVAGQVVTYSFTIRNTGDVTLTNVTLTDTVPGVTLTGSPIPSLAPGQQNTTAYSATYTLQPADIGSSISNTATVTGTPPTGPDVSDISGTTFTNDTPTTTPIPDFNPAPAISLDKILDDSATADGAEVGEQLTYAFTIRNTGNVTLQNVTLTDALPGIQLSGSPIPQLAPGESNSTAYTATYTVTATDISAGQVVNTATVVGHYPNGSTPAATDNDTETAPFQTIEAIPEVFPPFTGDGGKTTSMLASDRLNGGPATLSNVTITVLREDDGVTLDPTNAMITLAPGFPAGTYEVDYRICSIAIPTLCDETTETVVQLAIPEIETTKMQSVADDGDGTNGVGDTINYEITLENTGNIDLQEVTVTDTLRDLQGAGLALTSGPTFASSSAGSPEGQLLIGEMATYNATFVITQQAVDARGLENTVLGRGVPIDIPGVPGIPPEVTDVSDDGDDLDGNTSDDPTVLNLTPTPSGGTPNSVELTKSTSADVVRRGEAVPYTITVTNNDSTAIGPFTLTDTLPPGFIFIPGSASLTPSQTLAGKITWEGLNIPAQSSVDITLSARALTGARSGEHINRANLTDPGTGEPVVPEATATVRILPEAVFDCGDVIGKVFTDLNGNGYQDGPAREDGITDQTFIGGKGGKLTTPRPKTEVGIPNVRLVTVDGSIITTDQHGRYSVPCALLPEDRGSNFILKLDTRSLPTGYRVTTENPRVMRLTPGMMTEMNFGATIGKVVRVDLDGSAFGIAQNGKVALSAPLKAGIAQLLPQIANEHINLRLTFHVPQNADAMAVRSARAMLKATEKYIKSEWRKVGRTRLLVEQSIARAGE